MKTNILRDMIHYIEFLRDCGYAVSLSGFGNRFEPYTIQLLPYEVHLHSVCHYLKLNPNTTGKCILNKRKLNNAHIEKPMYSCCFAGVEEYVVPVNYNGECLMRIHISGYRGTLQKSKQRMLQISEICDQDFAKAYMKLSETPPSLEEIMRFVRPMEYMIIDLYMRCSGKRSNDEKISRTKDIYLQAIEYIHENYMYKISCEMLSKETGYSTAYLRYIFKKEGNVSIHKEINNIRLEYAKQLLLGTNMSITEIAFHCGFDDSNYFSTVFKNRYGASPRSFKNHS